MKITNLFLSLCLFVSLLGNAAASQLPITYRTDVNAYINQVAKQHKFDRKKLTAIFKKITLRDDIIAKMEKPFEGKPWHVYRKVFVTDKRAGLGAKFWHDHEKTLRQAEKRYGVPAEIIVAILGVETYYGKRQGDYRVIDALSTLAFNYPSRAKFFQKELTQYLLLTREQKLDPFSLYGSYAGAIGQPQFMPSSYRAYAVDFSGHGSIDLRKNTVDVIGSVANYFRRHGWQQSQPIIQAAKVKGRGFERLNTEAKSAKYSINTLRRHGVQVKGKLEGKVKPLGLIELNADTHPEFWVAYPNFYVITRYNTSKRYAMAVINLARQVKALHSKKAA